MYHDLMATALFSRKALSVLRPTTGRAGGKDLDNRGNDHSSIGSYIFFTNCKFVKNLKIGRVKLLAAFGKG